MPGGRPAAVAAMLDRLRRGGVGDAAVLGAMASVPREEFVATKHLAEAYADRALPIGDGQTISQPLMVALIVEALRLSSGDRALDVGTGSGYQAAVMAALGATVVSIERIPALADAAVARLSRLGYPVEVVLGDGSLGVRDRGPFDAIAVGAAAPRLPVALARQLRDGGRLVVPISVDGVEELTRLTVTGGTWRTEGLGPCSFVPLIGGDAYQG